MPNTGDTVYIRSNGTRGVVNEKNVNSGARQYNSSGPYDSVPYTEYGVAIPKLGINQNVMDGDFGGQLRRVPTVDFNGVSSLSKLDDPTVPWFPMNW